MQDTDKIDRHSSEQAVMTTQRALRTCGLCSPAILGDNFLFGRDAKDLQNTIKFVI